MNEDPNWLRSCAKGWKCETGRHLLCAAAPSSLSYEQVACADLAAGFIVGAGNISAGSALAGTWLAMPFVTGANDMLADITPSPKPGDLSSIKRSLTAITTLGGTDLPVPAVEAGYQIQTP